MYSINDHIENCNMDQKSLDMFLELFKLGSEIDPNRKISGVDIFRNFEYGIPLKWVNGKLSSKTKVLDIGSSSTIWPTLLFKKFGCNIHATDIDMTHLDTQKHFLYNIGALDELGRKFIFEHQDATSMTYSDDSFDIVFSVSSLEHIPGEGDVRAVEEIQRVLKPGGTFIITAPYSPVFEETETEHYHFSYEKRYDYKAIQKRFSSANKLRRKELLFINGKHEKSDEISDFWYKNDLYKNLGQISMFFSLLMFEITTEPNENTKGFMALYEKTP